VPFVGSPEETPISTPVMDTTKHRKTFPAQEEGKGKE